MEQIMNQKSNQIQELIDKIEKLEEKTKSVTSQMNDLEANNSHLTTKFIMSVEREGEIMKKYNQMKMQLASYEKIIKTLKEKS